jgi:nucleotide-binding universal stress UspA family protein
MLATQPAKSSAAFENILFATDFSPAANAALRHAAGLATSFAANLWAIHVKEPVDYAMPPEIWQYAQQTVDLELDQVRKLLLKEYPHLKTEVSQGEGGFWPSLAAEVQKHKVDLIVVGTSGRTGIRKALLGSKAEEILRHTSCPVLTVGPHAQEGQGKRGQFSSILYATDFGPSSLAAGQIAVSLALNYKAKLTALHIPDDRVPHLVANPEQFAESCERQLLELVHGGSQLRCAPSLIVEHGIPKDKILEVAAQNGADLIVMGAHSLIGVLGAGTHLAISTVHHVVANAKCPVLTVRK